MHTPSTVISLLLLMAWEFFCFVHMEFTYTFLLCVYELNVLLLKLNSENIFVIIYKLWFYNS